MNARAERSRRLKHGCAATVRLAAWMHIHMARSLMGCDPLYLALDQGGHASRALVFDAAGHVQAQAAIAIATQVDGARVEHDAEEMAASVRGAAEDAIAQLGARASCIVAAGLASQRSSIACWDRTTGAALSPVISWRDVRAAASLERHAGDAAKIKRLTGLPLSPHYGASKLRWCLNNLPQVRDAAADGRLAWGPLASFLTFRLTRERTLAADPSNAGRTLLWNLRTGDWDAQLLDIFALSRAALPPCVATRHDFGTLEIRDIPLRIVIGDQAAALFGHDMPRSGTGYVNIGTGAFLQTPLDRMPQDTTLLISTAFRDGHTSLYSLEGTVNGAGAALSETIAAEGLDEPGVFAHLQDWLREVRTPPLFLNGVGGLGSPDWRADAPTRYIGEGDAAARIVAVVESIVFLLQRNIDEMKRAGAPLARLWVSGGISRLDGVCQRLADLSGMAVHRPEEIEATARGIGRLLAPDAFAAVTDARVFRPASHAGLARRYSAWSEALEHALIGG